MKKKVIWIVIIVLAGLLVFAGLKLYNGYMAPIYKALKYSDEEIEKEVKSAKDIIKEETGLEVREMNDDEKTAVEKGETTAQQVYEKIINEAIEKVREKQKEIDAGKEGNKSGSENGNENAPQAPPPAQETVYDPNEVAAKYLAEIFALEGEYEGKITAMTGQAKEEYYHLRKVEKVGKEDAITSVGKKYFGIMDSLEAECDGKVNSILSAMESDLKSKNCDTTLVSSAKKAYEGEKEAKRAYYVKMIMN